LAIGRLAETKHTCAAHTNRTIAPFFGNAGVVDDQYRILATLTSRSA